MAHSLPKPYSQGLAKANKREMENTMKAILSKSILAATLGLALVFTFGCSSDDGDGSGGGGSGNLKGSYWLALKWEYEAGSSYAYQLRFDNHKEGECESKIFNKSGQQTRHWEGPYTYNSKTRKGSGSCFSIGGGDFFVSSDGSYICLDDKDCYGEVHNRLIRTTEEY